MGLQPLLALYLVLPMVIIYALLTWFGLAFVKQMANEKLRSDLELVGRAIRLPVSEALAKMTSLPCSQIWSRCSVSAESTALGLRQRR